MTLQAFVDDSRSEVDGQNLVLAGSVHNAKTWSRFCNDWQAALDANPAIEYFRMAEAQNLSGQFRHWTGEARDAKVLTLGKIIRKHDPVSFECWMSQQSFNKIVKPVAPYDLKSPYFMCFYGAIITPARFYASEKIKTPVDFIFDDQGGLGDFVALWYRHIKEWQNPAVSALLGNPPIFGDDKKVLPLQAADLLAWHLRRLRESRNAMERRPVCDYLSGTHIESWVPEELLRMEAQKMSAITAGKQLHTKNTSIRRLLKGVKTYLANQL